MIAQFLVLAATPAPSPVPTQEPLVDADLVTPGLGGFLALFVLALAVYFLSRSMARRVQRVNQRARAEEEARVAAAAGSGAPGTAGGAGEPGGAADGPPRPPQH